MSRVFFLIRSLDRGGAERQLVELARGLVSDGHHVTVCTFYDGGALRAELAEIDSLHLVSLGKRDRWDIVRFFWRLNRAVRASRPDIVHGYMPVANELAFAAAKLNRAKVVFGIRSSNVDFLQYERTSERLLLFRLGGLLSRFADGIIANSEAGRIFHTQFGYDAGRMVVIPNGVDCARFKPDLEARARVRAEWNIGREERLVGLVGRLDPKKDHANFVCAAGIVANGHPSVRFVCVGDAPAARRNELVQRASQLGVSDKLLWTGVRDDMNAVYNALDVCVLTSAFGEGFPNVVGEAMATGKACVVTRVGDAALVVGDTGVVVPPRDPEALARGIGAILARSDHDLIELCAAARARICEHFSTRRLVDATEQTLLGLLS